jgi:thioredoxin-dependent peroxiredoxin
MSKKTRKKSQAAGSRRAAGAGPKKTAQKSVRTTGRRSVSKTAEVAAKTARKTAAKSPIKRPVKSPVKTPARTAANKTKALAKTPPKPPKQVAAPEIALKKPGTVRAKKPAPEIAVEPRAIAPTETAPTETAIATAPATVRPASHETVASEGEPAPEFDLPRDGGERVSLNDHLGRKLVIFFYPRADTPGCTKEAMDFTRLKDDFAAIGTAILGVSADPLKAQESFRNKHRLSVPLISDETHEMIDAYGAWGEKSMYGRTFQGVLRTTVLIGTDGRIAKIWRGVRVDGHADDVLAAAASL